MSTEGHGAGARRPPAGEAQALHRPQAQLPLGGALRELGWHQATGTRRLVPSLPPALCSAHTAGALRPQGCARTLHTPV